MKETNLMPKCRICGAKVKKQPTMNPEGKCSICGEYILNVPRVGVGTIVTRNEKVLLLKRKNVIGEGTWSTPGGRLEFGESIEECAIRETREETGLTIRNVKFRAITNDIFQKEGKHYITIWMEGKCMRGEPKLNAPYESSEIDWFAWNTLPSNLFLPFKNLLNGKHYPKQSTTQ